jgi:hypothetical protein
LVARRQLSLRIHEALGGALVFEGPLAGKQLTLVVTAITVFNGVEISKPVFSVDRDGQDSPR